MKLMFLALITAACICGCSSPPSPPEPSGKKVWVNPADFEKFVIESQP